MVRSIMKVIANMLNSISIFTCGLFNRRKPMPMNKEQFSSCAARAGFIDAEGNFQVFLDRLYLKVMFRIRLHKDEINVLNKIQEILGVGRVLIDGNSVVFIISNVKDLINVLFPLLDKYNLFTTKWLDYIDFKKVVLFLSSSAQRCAHRRWGVQPLPEFLQLN